MSKKKRTYKIYTMPEIETKIEESKYNLKIKREELGCENSDDRLKELRREVAVYNGKKGSLIDKPRRDKFRAEAKILRQEKKRVKKATRRALASKKKVDFYWSDAWRQLRYKILRKYGFSCMACGLKPPDIVIHIDHIKPRSRYPELELEEDNLQVLCEHCNIGKLHLYEDDLRPGANGDCTTY